LGASGNGRWQFGSATGLYVVDPGTGEISIQGATPGSIPLVSVSLNKAAPPADTTITLNGVKLIRWAGNPLEQWTVDPKGTQPVVGSGGFIELVASDGSGRQRSMVLPCPSDIAMMSLPPIGSALSAGAAVQVSFDKTVVLNRAGIAGLDGVFPSATLVGYNSATNTVVRGALGLALIGAGQLGVTVGLQATTTADSYLMDVRWPGPWQIDGETGAFCGLAKRWTYTNAAVSDTVPVIVGVTPSSGSANGGDTVRIDGAGLVTVTGVTFDGSASAIVSQSDASIVVTTPAHAAGAVAILVSSPGGIATSTYTYVAAPQPPKHRAARH
jgi:hypothetical protein